jgi:putative monooxygenase
VPNPLLFNTKEHIFRIPGSGVVSRMAVGVELRMLVSAECGAEDFSTSLATFKPGAFLPQHRHPVGEAITVVAGEALLQVEARRYRITPLDCVYIPGGVLHAVRNSDQGRDLLVHSAFASAFLSRELVSKEYRVEDRGLGGSFSKDPERVVRYTKGASYELAENTWFTDLFTRRMGAEGMCGGYGRFGAGASLPCHIHNFDESITIVKGTARCQVEGRQHDLSGGATAYIPAGLPHRFVNPGDAEMAMIWVYAGPEPERRVLDTGYCAGSLAWPGPFLVR